MNGCSKKSDREASEKHLIATGKEKSDDRCVQSIQLLLHCCCCHIRRLEAGKDEEYKIL